ncbi:hypothetical protein F511_41929 [Dorcoceras hygrometricum]|uniref:Uncharacterized protein n=1 Tax=Dorcoceras hygrometricum TaxID=472368 RepID=A0A2Z7CYR6_9LAMI|nr:hypothetical protein F511_41929 [Dorcoceras hygrometricum]
MMLSAVMSSQSAVDKKRNYLESVMMTSAVMSSQSVVSYSTTSRWYLKLAIAKRCRLDKWIRQRFAFALRTSSSWMSTAELSSNVEDDKKPAKERTQGQFPVGTLQNIFQTGRICVQRIEFEQMLFKGEDLKEEDDDLMMIS